MKYHLIGLGGIGMSALARVLIQRGAKVQGSDANPSALLDELKREGAAVRIGHAKEAIDPSTTVIYSSAVKGENVELARAKELQLPLFHRSDFLDFLMEGKKSLLVTGTHGKTTTSSLLASVLMEAGLDPSFVLGGIHRNFKTNGRAGLGDYFVAEADESDGSFLKTGAFGAIVTNLEDEHLDYWKNSQFLNAAFAQFFRQAKNPKHLFWCGDDPRLSMLCPAGISYGFNEGNELQITSFSTKEKGIEFDLEWHGRSYSNIFLSLYGKHNALNGAAVFGLALSLGISEQAIRNAFQSFGGAARRLEWKGNGHAVDLYDDYGHHPTEIRATLDALRGKIGERRLVLLFQPHRYSRTRDLMEGFVEAFDEADLVVMTDVYSAGEAPIAEGSALVLYERLKKRLGSKVHFFPRKELERAAADLLRPHDVALTMGAGDITHAGVPTLDLYTQKGRKWTVALLFGGTSAEHEVSLMSAKRIRDSLDRSLYHVKCFGITKRGEWIYGSDAIEKLEQKISFGEGATTLPPMVLQELLSCEVAIPVFHGPQGEDGMFQGFLDVFNLPYVGCDYRSGALCMHKGWTKQVAILNGVPTASYIEIGSQSYKKNPTLFLEQIRSELFYPVWIKPVHLGSSIGVSRAQNEEEAIKAIEFAFSYDDVLIVEKEVRGIQVEYALLGNEQIRVAKSCEILNHGFHDYASKYGPTACGMAIPARISERDQKIGEELALKMYRASGCKGLARIDFFFDLNGYFWMNEINPFPGFTATSAYPSMWEESGMNLTKLCDEMVIMAFQRHRRLAEIRGK